MNKDQVLDKMKQKSGLTKKDADKALSSFIDVVLEGAMDGEKTSLNGFGVFEGRHRSARKARNPQTGEKIQVPEYYNLSFSPSDNVRDLLN